MEDWAEIRRLHRSEQMPIKAIARKLAISKNTVKRALTVETPPKYQRTPRGSIVDEAEPRIRELLPLWPQMPATFNAERIGWANSITVLKDRVRLLRPLYLPTDPVSRTAYAPGEIAQCDLWFPPADIPLGSGQSGRPPVLVIVSGYSRWLLATMLPTRKSEDLIAGMWLLLARLGALPKALVWDNESAVGSWRGGRPKLTEEFEAFRGSLGINVIQCRPRDPEAKGMVERANGYLETSFLPRRVFTGPQDFNTQLSAWLERANRRFHRRLQCRPADRLGADLAAMVDLPPVAPATGWRQIVRLPRDHYVRLDTCDYSVHPEAIGRQVMVSADLERVRISCAGQSVGGHERCWAAHQTLTDPDHAHAAMVMRRRFHHRVAALPGPVEEVEQRDLADFRPATQDRGVEPRMTAKTTTANHPTGTDTAAVRSHSSAAVSSF